jgi:hypothetical protein
MIYLIAVFGESIHEYRFSQNQIALQKVAFSSLLEVFMIFKMNAFWTSFRHFNTQESQKMESMLYLTRIA